MSIRSRLAARLAAQAAAKSQTTRERLRERISARQAPEAQAAPESSATAPEPVDPASVRERLKARMTPVQGYGIPEAPKPPLTNQALEPDDFRFPLSTGGIPFTAAEKDLVENTAAMSGVEESARKRVNLTQRQQGQQKVVENTLKSLKSLAPLAFPAHATQAILMGEPERLKQAWDMDIHWGTGKGEAALAEWPHPHEIARRTRAHFRARAVVMQQAQDRGESFKADFFTSGSGVTPELKEREYQRVVDEEEKDWFTHSVGTNPHDTLRENYAAYLEAGGDPEVSERVQMLNASKDWRPEDNGFDITVDRGLPYVGLAVGLELVDPLLPIGLSAPRAVKVVTEMDEWRRLGLVPALARERKTAEVVEKSLQQLDATPLATLVAAEKRISAAQELGIDPKLGSKAEALLDGERKVVGAARRKLEEELGGSSDAVQGSTIFRFLKEGSEWVVGAAIRRGDDTFVAPSHAMALNEAEAVNPGIMEAFADEADAAVGGATRTIEDGFITNHGRYLTREEALDFMPPPVGSGFEAPIGRVRGDGIAQIQEALPGNYADVDMVEIVDDLMAMQRTATAEKPAVSGRIAIRKKLKEQFPSAPDAWLDDKTIAVDHHVGPLRALREYISADGELLAARSIPERRNVLINRLADANANADIIEQEAIQQMGRLVAGEIGVNEVRHLLHNQHMQRFVDGFTMPDAKLGKRVRELTGQEWDGMGWSREGMGWMGHNLEPRDMLSGTGVWEAVRDSERAGKAWIRQWGVRFAKEFGDVVTGSKFDEKLGKALDSKLVGAAEDGSLRLKYTLADPETGKAVHSEIVELTADEAHSYNQARAMFDELAEGATAAGLKGFERGKPVFQDYFPRIYDFGKSRTEILREIPTELIDHVDSRVYFRHLQGRQFANRMAGQQAPLFSEGMRLYLRGMARKQFMEPALEEGERLARSLDKTKQSYWADWKRLLKGQRVKEGRSLDAWINKGVARVQQKTGKRILPHNAATKTSLAMTRMWIRGILGASMGSMLTNLTQSINTATRAGALDTLKGFMYMRTKEGRALAKELQLGDDFLAVMEKDLPSAVRLPKKLERAKETLNARLMAASDGGVQTLDDIVMAPMLYAENTNRGIALWTGITRAMRKRGMQPGTDLSKMSVEAREAVLREAMDLVEETQFIYGVMGTAPRFSGPSGRFIMTLSSFAPKQAAFLVRQAKADPTGIARFFAMSGFMTRMSREAMGVDSESVWGFGFIPPEVETFPFTSPQIQVLYNLWQYGSNDPSRGGDPFERQRALTNMTKTLGMLVPGPLGIPREAIPLEARNQLPALNQDIGSRAFRNTAQLFRNAGDENIRGRNEKLIRPFEGQEQGIKALGLQSEKARRMRELMNDVRAVERTTQLSSVNLQQRVAALFEEGDSNAAFELLAKEMNKGTITRAEMLRMGSFERGLERNVAGTNIDQLDRTLARTPGLAADEDLQLLRRAEQFRR